MPLQLPSGVSLPDHDDAASAGPGQAIHKEEIGQTYYPDDRFPGGVLVDNTSLHPGKYLTVSILDRIFRLLSRMIESVQKVAAAQAQRLTFLTDWQKAYTDLMNQVHAFVRGNGDDVFGNTAADSGQDENRKNLNQANATYTEQMRANRSIVSDDAKALQSIVNQSNDAVSQQANMATSIIQQFSTILGSIYR